MTGQIWPKKAFKRCNLSSAHGKNQMRIAVDQTRIFSLRENREEGSPWDFYFLSHEKRHLHVSCVSCPNSICVTAAGAILINMGSDWSLGKVAEGSLKTKTIAETEAEFRKQKSGLIEIEDARSSCN